MSDSVPMPVSVLARIAAAKSRGEFGLIASAVPYAQFMGMTLHVDADQLTTTMGFGPHLIGNPALPALHGGTLGALLETAAVFEVLYRGDPAAMRGLPKTITFTVEYLRSAGPLDTFAQATITRIGRRVANVSAQAWQNDRAKPVASANVLLMVG